MEQATLSKYQAEQRAWAEHNFPNTTYLLSPLEGLIEEIGECAHARLKSRQGIRGTPEQHLAEEKDACADAMVFLMDLANRHRHVIEISDIYIGWREDESATADTMFLELAYRVGLLADSARNGSPDSYRFRLRVDQVAESLMFYSKLRGWNFQEIFERTWEEVKVRDWIKFPKTGRPPEGEAA